MISLLEEKIDERGKRIETSRHENIAARVIIPERIQKKIKPEEPKYTPKETVDPEDSALYQRSRPKTMGSDGAKGGYVPIFHNPKQVDVPKLFSYVGSGVREQHEVEPSRQIFEHLDSPLTPEQGGRIIAGLLSKAVSRTNEHIPPETKERFLLWLQLPDGKVWLRHYETTYAVRTRDYNFSSSN